MSLKVKQTRQMNFKLKIHFMHLLFFLFFFSLRIPNPLSTLTPALTAKCDKGETGGNTTHREKRIISVLYSKFICLVWINKHDKLLELYS